MGVSEALRDYTEKKVEEHLGNFGGRRRPVIGDFVFEVEGDHFTVRSSVRAEDGFAAHVDYTGGDIYSLIDRMVDKLSAQWRRHKEKVKEHKPIRTPLGATARAGANVTTWNRNNQIPWLDESASIDAQEILDYERAHRPSRPEGVTIH
jgi:ribosomal subunit interface protein